MMMPQTGKFKNLLLLSLLLSDFHVINTKSSTNCLQGVFPPPLAGNNSANGISGLIIIQIVRDENAFRFML